MSDSDRSLSWEVSSESDMDVDEGAKPSVPLQSTVLPSLVNLFQTTKPALLSKIVTKVSEQRETQKRAAVLTIQRSFRQFLRGSLELVRNRNMIRASLLLTSYLYRRPMNALASTPSIIEEFIEHCAVYIQKVFRGFRCRKSFKVARLRLLLQAAVSGWKTRKILNSEPMAKLKKSIHSANLTEKTSLKKEYLATFHYLYGNVTLGRNKGRQPLQRSSKGILLLEKIQASVQTFYDVPRSNLLAPNHSSKRKRNRKSPSASHTEIKQKSMKLLELISSNQPQKRKKSTDDLKTQSQIKFPEHFDRLLFVKPTRFRLKLSALKKQFNSIDKMEEQLKKDISRRQPKYESTVQTVIPRVSFVDTTVKQLKEEYYRLTNKYNYK